MQSLKAIRRRIQSVKNTQKVTKAMKLVAAAKLKRAQREALSARDYTDSLRDTVRRISMRAGPGAPPIMRRRADIEKIDLLIFTSDRGLCGGFNENLLLRILSDVDEHISHGIDVQLFVIGKKGWQFLKKRKAKVERFVAANDEGGAAFVERIASVLTKRFLSRESDGAFMALNRFISAARQEPIYWDFLPLHWRGRMPDRLLDYQYEPDRDGAREMLCIEFLKRSIVQAMFETTASELAARMLAMDNATKNADDMISHLTLKYHKARQQAITAELLDIIGGANALRQ